MLAQPPIVPPAPLPPRLSVVVPQRNGEAAIDALLAAIAVAPGDLRSELLLVDDGSTDGTRAKCLALAGGDVRVRVPGHSRSAGQSAAPHSGLLAARSAIISTLDGDGQNLPENLPGLIAPLIGPEADPACGPVAAQRVGRKDSLSRRLASRFANALRSGVLRDGTRDTGCGVKALRREAFLDLPCFNHMHRHLPALFARDGRQVRRVGVSHAPRRTGRSEYGNLDRALAGIADLAGVAWLIHRRKRVRANGLAPGPLNSTVTVATPTVPVTEGRTDA